jgi:hypothetical protein
LICPVCKTNNTRVQNTEFCVQCGSDLKVHRLLYGVYEEMQMKNEITKQMQELPKKTSRLFIIFQTMPSIILLVCAVFGIFVGMRFLTFIDREESHRSSLSNKWSETGFEQLQQMNLTIKQELDLIMDQRRESQYLQGKIQELTNQILKNSVRAAPYSSIPEGQQ